MSRKYNIPEIIKPSHWKERTLFSCPVCGHESMLELLNLEYKFCHFHDIMMYYATCPDCGNEHIVLG